MVGWALATILEGPGGRHSVFGSLAWSIFLYLSAPNGVKTSSCPGSVNFEISPMDPPNQTPVKSAWVSPEGGGSPLYHQAPTAGLGLRGCAPRPCAAAGEVAMIEKTKTIAAVTTENTKRLFIFNLQSR